MSPDEFSQFFHSCLHGRNFDGAVTCHLHRYHFQVLASHVMKARTLLNHTAR
jgi:hypothetical protein